MIVLEDGQAVRQRSVPLPVVAPAPEDGEAPTGPGADSEAQAGVRGAAPEPEDSSDATVWLVTGGAVLLLFVGGGYHVVRRANKA